MSTEPVPIEVFYSYAHQDEAFANIVTGICQALKDLSQPSVPAPHMTHPFLTTRAQSMRHLAKRIWDVMRGQPRLSHEANCHQKSTSGLSACSLVFATLNISYLQLILTQNVSERAQETGGLKCYKTMYGVW